MSSAKVCFAAEEDLPARIHAGDEVAFEVFYTSLWPSLFFFLRGMIGDDAQAEDLVQEVFLRIWAKRDTIDVRRNLRAFAYKIARNTALDRRRREAREILETEMTSGEDDSEDFFASTAAANANPEDLVFEGEVFEKIQHMPAELRECLLLKYSEEFDQTQIAEIIGKSNATVHRTVQRAERHLMRSLGCALKKE